MEPIDTGTQWQLLFDQRFIDRSSGIALVVNQPVKGEPVLQSEMPWERYSISGRTVIEENGRYHMWYRAVAGLDRDKTNDPIACDKCGTVNEPGIICCKTCGHGLGTDLYHSFTCYAESSDGLRWERPKLGLVEFEGSTDNNIIIGNPEAPFLAPKDCPFKFIAVIGAKRRLLLLSSQDGIRWREEGEALPFTCDSQNQITWDDRLGRYVAYLRGFTNRRIVVRCEIDDLLDMPWPYERRGEARPDAAGDVYITQELPTILQPDEWDPPNSDIYTPGVLQYSRAADAYLAFPSVFRWYPGPKGLGGASKLTEYAYESEEARSQALSRIKRHRYYRKGNDGPLEVQIAVSRNGTLWQRPATRSYIALGTNEESDSGQLYMLTGLVRRGGELWQYYTASRQTHGYFEPGRDVHVSVIRRTVQRLDGFVAAEAGRSGGEFVTPPIRFDGDTLLLNVDCGAMGEARVELLDERGLVIRGYSLRDCDPIDRNELRYPVSWRGQTDLRRFAGHPIRMRIVLRSARLFAFRFAGGGQEASSSAETTP
jgi:hypothetical protein